MADRGEKVPGIIRERIGGIGNMVDKIINT
jgi:hypothetical protein